MDGNCRWMMDGWIDHVSSTTRRTVSMDTEVSPKRMGAWRVCVCVCVYGCTNAVRVSGTCAPAFRQV